MPHDPYAGFMWVKGRKNVWRISRVEEGKRRRHRTQADFDSRWLVHPKLTPQEIADLLHLSLAKTLAIRRSFINYKTTLFYLSRKWLLKCTTVEWLYSCPSYQQIQSEWQISWTEHRSSYYSLTDKVAVISIRSVEMMPLYREESMAFWWSRKKTATKCQIVTEGRYHYADKWHKQSQSDNSLIAKRIKNWKISTASVVTPSKALFTAVRGGAFCAR